MFGRTREASSETHHLWYLAVAAASLHQPPSPLNTPPRLILRRALNSSPNVSLSQNISLTPSPQTHPLRRKPAATTMALDTFYRNKIESMKLEIIQGEAVLRRLEAQRNDYNSRVRLLREELGLLQQPGSYVGEVVKVMGTKKVLVKVHPEGKYGELHALNIPGGGANMDAFSGRHL